MNVISRYVVVAVLRSVATVLIVIVSVTSVFQFVSQLDDVGVANYGFSEAVLYVVLGLPRAIFQSLPAATLLGSLLGLGHLATQSELISMRAAGVSKLQLVLIVGLAGLILAGCMAVLGESFAPSLGAYAREIRAQALLDESTLADGQSTWLRNDGVIVNVRRGYGAVDFDSGLYLFELSPERKLAAVGHAEAAEITAENNWALTEYDETRFTPNQLTATRELKATQRFDLNAELLGLSVVRHDLLDTPALQRYIGYLQANDLDAQRYLIAYWSRWADMVSVPFMAMLAVPFVFGSLRSAGSGARLVVGLCIGLGFYVADEVLANSGAVFNFDPLVVAWAPTAGLTLAVLFAVWKAR